MISFGYVESYAKIFLILYPTLENSTTRVAIVITMTGNSTFYAGLLVDRPRIYWLGFIPWEYDFFSTCCEIEKNKESQGAPVERTPFWKYNFDRAIYKF